MSKNEVIVSVPADEVDYLRTKVRVYRIGFYAMIALVWVHIALRLAGV